MYAGRASALGYGNRQLVVSNVGSERERETGALVTIPVAPTDERTAHGAQAQAEAQPEDHQQHQPTRKQRGPDALSSLDDILSSELAEEGKQAGSSSPNLGLAGSLGAVAGVVLLLATGVLLKDVIKDFLNFFIDAVEGWGPLGYFAYAAVYIGLEVLAVPAIPLTMTAGVIFGPVPGTIITSVSGTAAATIAFLIARYAARDRLMGWARRHPKFAAVDRAIARNGFRFVTLLRLSPLLPLAASNYLYGLTSVPLGAYVAGSWLGMLPGTYAYVSAGYLGKNALLEGSGGLDVESWQVALGLGVTLLAVGYVGRLAKTALDEESAKEADGQDGKEGKEGKDK